MSNINEKPLTYYAKDLFFLLKFKIKIISVLLNGYINIIIYLCTNYLIDYTETHDEHTLINAL